MLSLTPGDYPTMDIYEDVTLEEIEELFSEVLKKK